MTLVFKGKFLNFKFYHCGVSLEVIKISLMSFISDFMWGLSPSDELLCLWVVIVWDLINFLAWPSFPLGIINGTLNIWGYCEYDSADICNSLFYFQLVEIMVVCIIKIGGGEHLVKASRCPCLTLECLDLSPARVPGSNFMAIEDPGRQQMLAQVVESALSSQRPGWGSWLMGLTLA